MQTECEMQGDDSDINENAPFLLDYGLLGSSEIQIMLVGTDLTLVRIIENDKLCYKEPLTCECSCDICFA